MIPDAIKKQIKQGEGLHTEFKTGAANLNMIARTVCAFLNSHGGTVFCGVDDNGRIIGVENADRLRAQLHAGLLELISPKPLFTIAVDEEEGKSLLSIDVPEGKDSPYVLDGRVYIRTGATNPVDKAADATTLKTLVQARAMVAERWERRPSTGMEESDLDREEVAKTLIEARSSGKFLFKEAGDLAVLKALSLFNTMGFTQAADILFASNPALRHPQARVRYVRYATDKIGDTYLDDRVLQGPLVKVLGELFGVLSAQLRTESRFAADMLQRTDSNEYPLDALREGLVNAFAHRDYSGFSGGVVVSVFPSRIEIWNSGRLPSELKPGDLRTSHPSLPVNPDIAHVLYIRGLMERIGRGTQKILQACKSAGLPAPVWTDKPTGVTLTLHGRRSLPITMNDRQISVLNALAPGETLKPALYRQQIAMDISERQARRDLNELDQAGYLQREGEGAGTLYRRLNRTLTGH